MSKIPMLEKFAAQSLVEYDGELIFSKEKFAELIVRECIDILPEKVKIDDLYDGRILVQCGMAIKEHFGVEE